MSSLTVAAINLDLRSHTGLQSTLGTVRSAADSGAELIVLPECAVLTILGEHPEVSERETPAFLAGFSEEWVMCLSGLARELKATIVGGSVFERSAGGIQNVCPIIFPDGAVHRVAKNRLTTYEKEIWNLTPGVGLASFVEPPIGIAICYDSEFPEAGRALAESGAKLICVPAFTEGRRGFQRVRWSCQARAIENQVYVAHASLVGSLGREPVPEAYGSSAILCPSIEPFPESAVLAETALNEPGIAVAQLAFAMLDEVRQRGDVRNWNDRQPLEWQVRKPD